MSSNKARKTNKRQLMVRIVCLVLAGIMVLGVAIYLIMLIGGA